MSYQFLAHLLSMLTNQWEVHLTIHYLLSTTWRAIKDEFDERTGNLLERGKTKRESDTEIGSRPGKCVNDGWGFTMFQPSYYYEYNLFYIIMLQN